MRATYRICVGLCVGLAFELAACKDLEQCEDPGVAEACMCGDDAGERVCQPEYVWSDCDCNAATLDSGATSDAGGAIGDAGGGTGGTGGTSHDAGAVTGGTGDAGGMTGDAGGMTGGAGGDPVDGGGDSGEPSPTGRYGACTLATAATDCGSSAECRESDLPFLSLTPLTICAPACAETDDCPPPPSGGAAMLACVEGQCVLTCDVAAQDCPTGLTCNARGAFAFFCFTPAT